MQPISIPSSFGMANSSVEVYTNNDGSNGVLLTSDGVGEIGKPIHAGGSIPALIEAGGTVPGGLLVVNVEKPNEQDGRMQGERYIDALDWVIKTYPKADASRFYATGLSLGGGAIFQLMANPVWSKRFAALVPVAGTKDATWQNLIAGVKASPTPFRIYGSSKDPNTPTQEAFNNYSLVANGFDPAHVLNTTGKFIDLLLPTHGGLWPIVYAFNNTDFWGWLTAQKRSDVAPPVVVVPPVVPPVTPPAKKLIKTITIKVYDTGDPETIFS